MQGKLTSLFLAQCKTISINFHPPAFYFSTLKKNVKLIHRNPIEKTSIAEGIKYELKKNFEKSLSIDPAELLADSPNSTPINESEPNKFMKIIDSSFEGFFYQRDFNVENFNFYIQVLSKQQKSREIGNVFKQMETLGISPDERIYVQAISAYGKDKNVKMANQMFDEALEKGIGDSVYIYNGLLMAYAKSADVLNSQKVIREMKEKGIHPNAIVYTTLIDAYARRKDYAKTHECEKALRIYELVESEGFIEYCVPYNHLISALGSRHDYAAEAINIWRKMKMTGIIPDSRTISYVLRACSKIGEVATATEVLQYMKINELPMNVHNYCHLIGVYARAVGSIYQEPHKIEEYITDSWNLISIMTNQPIPINRYILNQMVFLYCNALQPEGIEGLVLPMFDQYSIPYDHYTYQLLMRLYLNMRNLDLVLKLFDQLTHSENANNSNLQANQEIYNIHLEVSMRVNDIDRIMTSLEGLQRINKTPRKGLMIKLAKTKDIPDRLYMILKNWEYLYTEEKEMKKRFRGTSKRDLGRRVPKQHTGKRLKLKKGGTQSGIKNLSI